MKLAITAVAGVASNGKQCRCDRGAETRSRNKAIRSQLFPEPSQQERPADSRDADGAEQHTVQRGTAGDLRASDQRQERPVRAAKYEECDRANQSRSEMGAESGITQPGAYRASEGFGRQG